MCGQGNKQPHPRGCGHVPRFSVDIYPTLSLHFSLFSFVINFWSQIFSPFLNLTPWAACHRGTSKTSSGLEASGTEKLQLLFNLGGEPGNNLIGN